MSPTTAAAATPTVARRILPLYPAVGASYFGYAMMATLFVPMLLSRTDGYLPAADSLARRTTVIGVLLILYPLGQFFGNSVLGALSDRCGRRPLILVSSAATIVCYLGIASALEVRDLVLLAPFLLVCGVVETNTALAMSAIADVTSDADRPRYIAFVFAVTSVSYTMGPVMGGVLAQASGYAVPFWIWWPRSSSSSRGCSSGSPRRCRPTADSGRRCCGGCRGCRRCSPTGCCAGSTWPTCSRSSP